MKSNILERRFRAPRLWSNLELKKFAKLFDGDVVNVSGWRDEDKEGQVYRSYFSSARSYTITNYKSEARGYQGGQGEIFLDLTLDLPPDLVSRFDTVFNHTTLEHIFEVDKAFSNLCLMSRDVVIVIVPFLQEMHAEYGDFWRFTPLAVKRMFEKNNFQTLYMNFNTEPRTSVYVFAIASRYPEKWNDKIPNQVRLGLSFDDKKNDLIGYNAFVNDDRPVSFWKRLKKYFGRGHG